MLKPRNIPLAEISPDPIFSEPKLVFQGDQSILDGHIGDSLYVEMVDSRPQYREFI
jgi:hypothetical protein